MFSRLFKISILIFAGTFLMSCSLTNISPTPVATLVFSTRTAQIEVNAEATNATPTQLPSDTPTQLPSVTPPPTTQLPSDTPPPPTNVPATSTLTLTPTLIPPTRPANPTLKFDSVANAYRIEFGAGGTWAQYDGTLDDSNQSVRYALSATRGQVMSVSIVEGLPFFVEVVNGSNQVGNAQVQHPFWRGSLPTTGDYIVTVTTQMPGNYTLRVAINPPSQAHQYFDYQHSLFRLRYSDEFSPTTYTPIGEFKGSPSLILNFINSDFYGPITNLSEAYFMVNTVADTGTCTQVSTPGEVLLGQRTFNGKTFTESQFLGAAAGNIYEQLFYRAVFNGTCYEIAFFMHSGNIGNYPPGTVVEFDRTALLQKFEEVLATFTIN